MTLLVSGGLRADRDGTASFSVLAVLLLVMSTYALVCMESSSWRGAGTEGPSLAGAEAELGSFLAEVLDRALEMAVPVAAVTEGVGLGDALDAVLVPLVRQGLPMSASGWEVGLVDVEGGLGPGPSGAASPWVATEVGLFLEGDGPPVRLRVQVGGPPGQWGELTSRASWVALSLDGRGGPVAIGASDLLWRDAQARAFSGVRGALDLVSEEDVTAALVAILGNLEVGGPVPAAGPPSLDLECLVRQSMAGVLERHLGWVGDYVWGDVDEGSGGRLRSAIVEGLSEAVTGVLVAASEGGLPVVEGDDLEDAVTRGLGALEGLDGSLDGPGLSERTMAWLERLAPGLPDVVRGPLVSALASAANAAGRLGLACARDSLLAVGHLGRQVERTGTVAGTGNGMGGAFVGLSVRPEGLSVSTGWSGVKASEPPDLLSRGGGGTGLGTLPYSSTCRVSVQGEALLEAVGPGASGRSLGASWRVPVDLGWDVTVVTGRPLEGVTYAPSATLTGDLGRVADAVMSRAAGSLGWLTARFRDAAEAAGAWGSSLLGDMRGTLMTESAYTLSRALWGIGDALMDNETGEALNGTWDLFSNLFGDDLREAMTWELDVVGSRLVIALDPLRQQVQVSLGRGHVSMNVTARRLCDPHPPFRARPVEGYHWGVFGEGRLDLEGRRAVLHLDPLTLERGSVLTMEVGWGDEGEGGTLVVEALEARRLGRGWSVSLSDLSGAGGLLTVAGGGMADAGIALHGDAFEEGAARKALERAMKDAWLATMRGWKVGDLLGETGRGPDAETFLGTLMRELHAALVARGTALVGEIEVFLEVSFPSPGWPSVRLSLVLAEPLEALLPLAAWVRGALDDLLDGALTGSLEGTGGGLSSWLAEHLLVRFELAWAVGPPSWLASRAGGALPDTLGLVVRGEANVAALAALAGSDMGIWSTSLEVMLRGVPGAVLALVPGMGSPRWRWAEVTLARVTVREVSAARVLVSQVLYDVAGRDAELEYVELINAGRRLLDLRGYALEDASGTFKVRCHAPVLPGDRVLVVRNSSAVRERWGVVPDIGRMGLRLANDGDLVRVLDPEGVVLDLVAWEGQLEGWEDLEAGEGRALLRLPGDERPACRSAWCVGDAGPRGSTW